MLNNNQLLDKNYSGFLVSILRIFQLIDNKSKRKFLYLSFFSALTSLSEILMIYSFSDFLIFLQADNNPNNSELFLSKFFSIDNIFQTSIFLTLITIFTTSLRLLITWIGFKYQADITAYISKKVLVQINNLGYENRKKISDSKKTSLLTVQINVMGNAITALTNMVSGFFLGIGILLGILSKDGKLVIFFGLTISFIYILLFKITKPLLVNNSKVIANSQINKIDLIKRFTLGIRETILETKEKKLTEKYFVNEKLFRKKMAHNGFINSFPRFFIEGSLIVTIAFVSLLSISKNNIFLISELGAISLGTLRFVPCFQAIYIGISSIRGISKSIFYIFQTCFTTQDYKFINRENTKTNPVNSIEKSSKFSILKKIEAINVSYQYPNTNKDIIQNCSLVINRGDKIAFLGESGIGKSTFMDILIGLIPCKKGRILFNNFDIFNQENKYYLNQLRKKISCISLENHIPNQSIIEYITSKTIKEITYKEIEDTKNALRKSEFCKKSNIGNNELRNKVGEECSNLSSGQKQRLVLARSIYRKCDWLFLDEPTSSIDQKTSIKIIKNLINNEQLTLLIITHDVEIANLFDVKYKLEHKKLLQISK